MNIYIPDSLKEKMDSVEGEGVNWSATAADAFEAKLAEIEKEKKRRTPKYLLELLQSLQAEVDTMELDKADAMYQLHGTILRVFEVEAEYQRFRQEHPNAEPMEFFKNSVSLSPEDLTTIKAARKICNLVGNDINKRKKSH